MGSREVVRTRADSVATHSSRSTPRRSAAVSASTKLTLPTHDVSSDLSEPETDEQPVRRLQKGKGKAIVLSSDSEADAELDDDEMDELDDDNGDPAVQEVRALAKALKASRSDAAPSKARGAAVGKRVASQLAKGKGKAVQKLFQVVVPVYGSSASTAGSSGRKGKAAKSKQIVLSSGSEGSDFEPPSEVEESDGAGDESEDAEMEMAEFLSDVDSEDDRVDHREKLKKMAKKAKDSSGEPRLPARKGAELSTKQKSEMKKMSRVRPLAGRLSTPRRALLIPRRSQFDKTAVTLNANHPELVNCWSDLAALPVTVPTRAIQPAGLTQKLLPFQLEGLNWMVEQERGPWGGGMLADEMGMGKTIQVLFGFPRPQCLS